MKKYKEARIKAECVEQVCEYIEERLCYLHSTLDSYIADAGEVEKNCDDTDWYSIQCDEIRMKIESMESLIEKLTEN